MMKLFCLCFRYTIVHDYEHFWTNEETKDISVATLSKQEYKQKSSINHEYYIYKLYTQNCFSKNLGLV